MSVFNFRNKKDKSDDIVSINENVIEEEVEKRLENEDNNNLLKEVYESLEYTNSFLAQISLGIGELVKQQTIANALHILDQQYNNADSLMDVEEILQKQEALLSAIFVDYQVKEKEENENE